MMKINSKKILQRLFTLLLAPTLCGTNHSFAQTPNKNTEPLKFILVQLKQEHNREVAMKQSNSTALLQRLYRDRDSIQKVTIRDFNDNFKCYPVYFFNDTDMDKIEHGDFNKTVIDANGNTVQLPESSTAKYYIITFGTPSFQRMNETYAKGTHDDYVSFPKGFYAVVNDKHLRQKGFVRHSEMSSLFGLQRFLRPYSYRSKDFDMNYIRCAHRLNKILKNDPEKIGVNEI